jgi:hypothetical protein
MVLIFGQVAGQKCPGINIDHVRSR